MSRPVRVLTLLLVVPATFYFTLWVPFALLPNLGWLRHIAALACAATVGRWTWRRMAPGTAPEPGASLAGFGALLIGSVGFLAGFLGPIFLHAGDQGPLVGIFLTGPLGLLVGFATGAAVSPPRASPATARVVLGAVAALLGGGTLFMSIPTERRGGYLLDITATSCEPAADGVAAAAASWEKSLREHPAWTEREGWQGDIDRMTSAMPGVKLEVDLHSSRVLTIHGRPWERGEVRARDWSRGRTVKRWYFVPVASGGCDGIPLGERRIAYVKAGGGGGRAPDPPATLPGFLRLGVLRDVPPAYLVYADHGPDSP